MTEEATMFNLIEFRLLNQRMVEILDDLNLKSHPLRNQKLNQQLKGVYAVLDKQTKNTTNYSRLVATTRCITTSLFVKTQKP